MIEKSPISSNSWLNSEKFARLKNVRQSKRILGIAIVINVAIASATLLILQTLSPIYTSKGSAIIQGVGTQGSVELGETGQTSNETGQTPYGYLLKVDPRENYQYISQTEKVLAQAAAAVDMSIDEFGEPVVWLDKGTTIIEFTVNGETPEEAQQKAWAFYQAWVDRISALRDEEAMRQSYNIEQKLSTTDRQIETTQKRISEFRGQSPLKVASQIEELAEQVENLRIQRADLTAQQKGVDARLRQLSSQLNFTTEQARDALILLDDKVFQSSLQNYSGAIANIEDMSSMWSANSPQVRNEIDKKETAQRAMLQRSRSLLGKPIDLGFLAQLDLGGGGRQDFVRELFRLQVEREGLATQVQTMEEQIEQLELRLKNLTQEQFTLNRLERNSRISELIFAEGLARLDVNKPDYATYYPPLQLIEEPVLPSEKDGSISRTILLGALAFCILSTTGLLMIWWGKSQPEKLFDYSANSDLE